MCLCAYVLMCLCAYTPCYVIFVLSVMCDLIRSCVLVRLVGIAGDGSYLHAIGLRLGYSWRWFLPPRYLMDIVWMEMTSPCPDDGLARDGSTSMPLGCVYIAG